MKKVFLNVKLFMKIDSIYFRYNSQQKVVFLFTKKNIITL